MTNDSTRVRATSKSREVNTAEPSTVGLPCIKCGRLTWTIDSRRTHLFGVTAIRRRRKCRYSKCKKRFTTYEILESFVIEVEAGRKILAALSEAVKIASQPR